MEFETVNIDSKFENTTEVELEARTATWTGRRPPDIRFSARNFWTLFFATRYATVNRPRDKDSLHQTSVIHRTQHIRSHRSPFRSTRLPPPQRSSILCLHTTSQPSHLAPPNIPSLPRNLSREILQDWEIPSSCHC